MLKLTYTRKNNKFQTVTLLGNAAGIRDLYWQLTHNYQAQDGTAIGEVNVYDLDGVNCTASIMTDPHGNATRMSTLQ